MSSPAWQAEPPASTSLASLCEAVTNFVEGCPDDDGNFQLGRPTTREDAIQVLRGVLDDLEEE